MLEGGAGLGVGADLVGEMGLGPALAFGLDSKISAEAWAGFQGARRLGIFIREMGLGGTLRAARDERWLSGALAPPASPTMETADMAPVTEGIVALTLEIVFVVRLVLSEARLALSEAGLVLSEV
jgi:hypothetical protein